MAVKYTNCIAIGDHAGYTLSTETNVILMGAGVQARASYEFAVLFGHPKHGLLEARTIMTPEEWKVVHAVFTRALANCNKRG